MDIGVRLEGVLVGRLAKLDSSGIPWVELPGSESGALPARTTAELTASDVGSDVVTAFEEGDTSRPIILGVLRLPGRKGVEAKVDGESVVVTGRNEITLRCGKASITLTKAGKVLVQGTYLSSRSSGAHRIKGGSVQIN
jgi:uncharacterized protein DUF6484